MKHGTEQGFQAHRQHIPPTPACDACRRAHSQHERARSIRAERSRNVLVPVTLLAELYLAAPADLILHVEDTLGEEVCDALVVVLDKNEAAA